MTKTPYVLIIEDDVWLAEQYTRTLKGSGIRTKTVTNAIAAIDMINTTPPHVILLDIFLIGPNAFTFLHELRSYSDLATIPVILCTTSADQLASEDLAVYGIQDVLNKTIMRPHDIVAAIKKVLL